MKLQNRMDTQTMQQRKQAHMLRMEQDGWNERMREKVREKQATNRNEIQCNTSREAHKLPLTHISTQYNTFKVFKVS